MIGFHRVQDELYCDEVAVTRIARDVGTPVHVYSAALIAARARALEAACAGCDHRLHYAIKANATLAIVKLMRASGLAADANSIGEIEVALRAGFEPRQIVFTGVGKTPAELDRAVALGLAAINVESPGEVERIEARARALATRPRVAVRVNPDIDPGSHPHISTGQRTTKFGMAPGEAVRVAHAIAARPWLKVVGLHAHIGSQVTEAGPIRKVADLVAGLARDLVAAGVPLEHLDLGGGLGIPYRPGDTPLALDAYAAIVTSAVCESGLTLLLEPGRWLVGPAGVLVSSVVDVKSQPDRPVDPSAPAAGLRQTAFVVVDAGMTDLLRPALYGAWHEIEPVSARAGEPMEVDIVGPVCETSDTLGAGRRLPPLEAGDLVAIRDTGAYGAVMASNYNRRPMAAEVLVEGAGFRTIRRRQTIDDMLQWDE